MNDDELASLDRLVLALAAFSPGRVNRSDAIRWAVGRALPEAEAKAGAESP